MLARGSWGLTQPEVLPGAKKDVEKSQRQAPTADITSTFEDNILSGTCFKIDSRTATPIDSQGQRVLSHRHGHGHGLTRPDGADGSAVEVDDVCSQAVGVTRSPPNCQSRGVRPGHRHTK